MVMQLVEQNLLQLDDPISSHLHSDLLHKLPSNHYLNTLGKDITLRMLLNHTSGIPNPLPLDWFFTEDTVSSSSLVEKRQEAFFNVLKQSPKLNSKPGMKYNYSNVGYWILEKAIEHVTGKSYDDAFVEQIAVPLGLMENNVCSGLTFDLPSSDGGINHNKNGVLAVGHSLRYSLQTFIFYLLTPKVYWSSFHNHKWSCFNRLIPHGMGYGGLYASVEGLSVILADLLKGIKSLSSEEQGNTTSASSDDIGVLLSFESKREMFGLKTGSPLGWAKGTVCVGNEHEPYFTKPGGGIGFHGNMRIYPRLGMATIYLCNGTCVSPGPINDWSDAFDSPFISNKRGSSICKEGLTS